MYDSVIKKFEKFFHVRKNVIFERGRFNRRNQAPSESAENVIFERGRFNGRNQAPSESAEEYIMALYKLAEDCVYGNMKSNMI